MEQRQRTVAIALVWNQEEGKILLQQRRDVRIPEANGKWESPGGLIDHGESPEEAARRECLEETGCEVIIKRLLPFAGSNRWQRCDGIDLHVIVLCYEAAWRRGEPAPRDPMVADVRWFSPEEALGMDLLPGLREFIEASVSQTSPH
jgi:8-oxo-dGTP diphosphatase